MICVISFVNFICYYFDVLRWIYVLLNGMADFSFHLYFAEQHFIFHFYENAVGFLFFLRTPV